MVYYVKIIGEKRDVKFLSLKCVYFYETSVSRSTIHLYNKNKKKNPEKAHLLWVRTHRVKVANQPWRNICWDEPTNCDRFSNYYHFTTKRVCATFTPVGIKVLLGHKLPTQTRKRYTNALKRKWDSEVFYGV